MGNLNFFNLKYIASKVSIDYFFESGTGGMIGLMHAYRSLPNTKFFYSCEIMDSLANSANKIIKDNNYDNIKILTTTSVEALKKVLPRIPKDKSILFWLDGHYPGADYGLAKYNDYKHQLALPLSEELNLIKEYRKECKDIILIDDLRIYKHDAKYTNGNIEDPNIPIGTNDGFLETFAQEMDYKKCYFFNDEGYILLHPKTLTLDLINLLQKDTNE